MKIGREVELLAWGLSLASEDAFLGESFASEGLGTDAAPFALPSTLDIFLC